MSVIFYFIIDTTYVHVTIFDFLMLKQQINTQYIHKRIHS